VAGVFDIAVVGAGPAGSVLAYAAARRGLSVALIDRQAFPRDKPCGDGIGPAAVRRLNEVGLGGIFTSDDVPTGTVRIIGPDDVELRATITDMGSDPVEGYVIPRADFDNRLFDQAIKAGATDFTGMKVVGTTMDADTRTVELRAPGGEPQQIRARLLAGADGANSVVRRALGVPASTARQAGLAVRAYARTSDFDPSGSQGPRMLFSFSRDLLPSYAWLFPTGRGIVNIGVGGPLAEIRRTHQELRQTLARFADQVRAEGITLGEPYDLRGHHLPHFGGLPQLAHPRAVLIGDAASMINPFSGEGISYGITAAARLAVALPADLSDPRALQAALADFERGFHRAYNGHMRSTLLLHRLMARPFWARLFISAAARDQVVLRDAIELLFGFGQVHITTALRILRTLP
jgi:geranylgeranyl reductase family protein